MSDSSNINNAGEIIIKGNIVENNVLINSIQLSFSLIVLNNNDVVFTVTG